MIKENFGLDILDLFARTFIYQTIFTKSLKSGILGGASLAVTRIVSKVTLPFFKIIPYAGEVFHQFTRGFTIKVIYTRNIHSSLSLGLTYAAGEAITSLFKKVIHESKILEKTGLNVYFDQLPDNWYCEVYFVIRSQLCKGFTFALTMGAISGLAKIISLLFQKIIIDYKPIQKSILSFYISDLPENCGLETLSIFIKGFVTGTLLNANPISGITSGILSVTAFHIYALYESQSMQFR